MNDIIAKRLGVNIVYKVTALSGGLAGLTSGQYDLMSVHMSQTPERAASVSFTKPVIWSSDVLAVPTDSPISSPEQTAGKRIGATTGSAQLQYVQENLTSARLISEPSDTASISEILAHRLDGVALSSTNASAVLGANKSTIKLAFSKLHDGPSAEAVNKKLTTFLTAYNDQLSALATDGTMLRLYEKYFPDLPYPTQMYQYWPVIQQQVAKEGPR